MISNYDRTPHWPQSLCIHRDDREHPDPHHFVGKPVVITEKLDGGLTQFTQGLVFARSSNAPASAPWFDYVKSRTLPKLHALPPHLVAIGEDLYAIHSIEYAELPDSFFLFHILDREISNIGSERTENDQFWSWSAVKTFAEQYELHLVPECFVGVFESTDAITKWFMDHIGQPSAFGPVCEGFVLRLAGGFSFASFGRNMCKFVRANHVQTDARWEQQWRKAKIIAPSR